MQAAIILCNFLLFSYIVVHRLHPFAGYVSTATSQIMEYLQVSLSVLPLSE